MGGEGGEALLNALLVADVRQHPVIDRHGAAVRHGDVEAALGHQRQQAQGLEAHGLAAGVGPGDHQSVEGPPQLNVNADRRLGVQQGVPGLAEVNHPVPANLRPHAVHLVAQLAPGKDQVQVDQGVVVPLDGLPVGRRLGGELGENPVDLLLLLGLQLHVLVVGLNHPHGLHEHRGPGGGDVVNQPRQVPFVLRLHRHHKASVPLSDDGLLQYLPVGGRGDDLLQNLAAPGLGRPHVPPDVRQFRRRGVGDGVLIGNAPLDLLLQKAVAVEGEEEVVNGGLLLRLVIKVLPGPPGGGQKARDGQKLPGIQSAAPVRPVQGFRHRPHAGKGGAPPQADHGSGGVGLVQKAQNLLRLRLRAHPESPVPGLRADGLFAQQLQHPGQFQGADGFFKQLAHASLLLSSGVSNGYSVSASQGLSQPKSQGGKRTPYQPQAASASAS